MWPCCCRAVPKTSWIASATARGWSICMLWPLPVTTMCLVYGTSLARGVLCLVPRTVADVTEVLRDEGGQLVLRDRRRDDRPHGIGAGVTGQYHDRQGAAQRRSGAGLGPAGVDVDPFHGRVLRELLRGRAGYGRQVLPLLRRECCLPLRRERIDEHDAGYLAGVLARVEPGDQATVGVAGQDIRAGLAGGPQEGCRSLTASCAVVGWGTGVLRLGVRLSPTGAPGRSQAHTRANLATRANTAIEGSGW